MSKQDEIRKELEGASDEARELILRTLTLERRNLHYKRPPDINDQLEAMVEEIVK